MIVAVHESGHAVMARFFNLWVREVSIETNKGKYFGRTLYYGATQTSTNELVKEHTIYACLGGAVASFLYDDCATQYSYEDDVRSCLPYIRKFRKLATIEDLIPYLTITGNLLSEPSRWGAVLDLAEALIKQRILVDQQVDEIINNTTHRETPKLSFEGKVLYIQKADAQSCKPVQKPVSLKKADIYT